MIVLDEHWFGVHKSKSKFHYLHDDKTLCGIHKSHLSNHPRIGKIFENRVCQKCLYVFNTYSDLKDKLPHDSLSDNHHSKSIEMFEMPRYYGKNNPMYPNTELS